MSSSEVVEAIPVLPAAAEQWEQATRFFEQASSVGCRSPEVAYLLAICYKRRGRFAEARNTLRKITPPDANVLLQLGLLSFAEKQYAQAEDEFARSVQADASSFAASFNLLLARLYQAKFAECLPLLPQVLALAPTPAEQHFLSLLGALIQHALPGIPGPQPVFRDPSERVGGLLGPTLPPQGEPTSSWLEREKANITALQKELQGLSKTEEERLVLLVRSLQSIEVSWPLLRTLAAARPTSPVVQQAYLELTLVQARKLMDRCDWSGADALLRPLVRALEEPLSGPADAPEPIKAALLNLQGCCACMLQDFERGIQCFNQALKKVGRDAWLYQNLALAYEMAQKLDQADTYWNRFFDLLDGQLPTAPLPGYPEALAFEGLCRLSDLYARSEHWNSALAFLQRAQRLRPRDMEVLDRLFHLQIQIKRPDDARKTLRKLRDIRPDDPRFDLYELDLRELRSIDDVDRIFADIKRIISRHPGDMRVEDRAVSMVASFIPVIQRRCEQLLRRVDDIDSQVRCLHDYQINWPVVHDEMHELRLELQKLRRICNKCLGLVVNEDLRHIIREMNADIDRRIDQCLALGG